MYNIGIDVGGTTIKCGIVKEERVLFKKAVKTPVNDPQKALFETVKLVSDLLSESNINLSEIENIGIGLPGTVHKGIVTYANNLGWYDVPFESMLSQELGRKVYSDNDARCALYAELAFGAGRDKDNVLEITLGTGVGSAFTSNGTVHRGNRSSGGEGGLIHYLDSVWEEYASTLALVRRVEGMKGNKSELGKYLSDKEIDGRVIFEAEQEGIKGAREVIDEHIRHIATGIVSLVNFLRPETVIIGGGIAKEGERIIKPLSELINSEAYGGEYNPSIEITPAKINDAGIVGATVINKFN